jgi:predicted AlkP superfamily pyrophosphatase or phosphodiesterase
LSWLDLPQEKRPRFITLYFEDTDEAGHRYGPDSKNVIQAIKNLDDALGLLTAGIKKRGIENETTVILVSDHGMSSVERSHRVNLKNYILSSEARVVGKGAIAFVWPKGKAEEKNILERIRKKPGAFSIYTKENIPARYHFSRHRRIPPLIFLAKEGWYLEDSLVPPLKPSVFGLHGYDNSLSNMQAVFLAVGPEFPKGKKVGEVQNIDIYPLLAHLLKIKAETTDGDFGRVSNVLGLQ